MRPLSLHYWRMVSLIILVLTLVPVSNVQKPLASQQEYHKYIDPLLEVKDFGGYFDDAAADASILFPGNSTHPSDRPNDPAVALVRLGEKGTPLLIDCLSDGRVTNIRFGGNYITKPMSVPVGYVCLDILMGTTSSKSLAEHDCADDGLGACMNSDFYFRPDDYYDCVDHRQLCLLRPWILVVQRNWRREFLRKRLHFQNPYSDLEMDKHKELTTPKR